MKHRFEAYAGIGKKTSSSRNFILSIAGFLAIVILFWLGTSLLSDRTDSRQAETLKHAITRGIAHCYATEGSYPESLQYLKENYGITYDEDRFFVDYQALGSNLMPDVTIIDRRDRE